MNYTTSNKKLTIALADDDADDCFFFKKALSEIPVETELTIVRDGEELMDYLRSHKSKLPDVVFLDLSMPRKTGFECLQEIKEDKQLKEIEVVMLSTSYPRDVNYETGMIKLLHDLGATSFIRKPGDYKQIKQLIHDSILKLGKV